MDDVQVILFGRFNDAVHNGAGFRAIHRVMEKEVLPADDVAFHLALCRLSEHSHKARYPKKLLIRIFSRKALLQAAFWEKDAHKIPGQTYNYVIKLKEVA